MSNSLDIFLGRLQPVVPRKLLPFAEAEVRLPKGPRRGLMFDGSYAPFSKFILAAIENPRWRRVAVVGPTQNGKTLLCTNIPLLYYLFELQEDVIFGLPSMNMAAAMWKDKLKPVIAESNYAHLLPTSGAGSQGGEFTSITFKNGVTLTFMGAGGGAAQQASITSRIVILTEVDKMATAAEESGEADPVTLMQKRSDAFEDSVVILECTVTVESGRIWQETMVVGSGAELFVACPYCGTWQTLEREGLVFDDSSMLRASETAAYKCCECDALWTNDDRLEALDDPREVMKGQTIDHNGVVCGDLPETLVYGLRYNVLHSPLQSLGKTAAQQFEADTSEIKDIKKDMCQSKWAKPWVDEDVVRNVLTVSHLRKMAQECVHCLRIVPEWADVLIMTTDIQEGYAYFHIEAYNLDTMRSMVVDYGTVDQRQANDTGVLNMLDDLDRISDETIAVAGGGVMSVSMRGMDTGYRFDVLEQWLLKHPRWTGVKGLSKEQRAKMTNAKAVFEIPSVLSIRPMPSGLQIYFIEVDNTKALVHDRYLLESPERDGYRFVANDVDVTWMNSICAETRIYEEDREGFTWKKKSKRNDYLDCSSYGVGLFYFLKEKCKRKAKHEQKIVAENYRRHGPALSPTTERAGTRHSGPKSPKHQRNQGGSWFSHRGATLRDD